MKTLFLGLLFGCGSIAGAAKAADEIVWRHADIDAIKSELTERGFAFESVFDARRFDDGRMKEIETTWQAPGDRIDTVLAECDGVSRDDLLAMEIFGSHEIEMDVNEEGRIHATVVSMPASLALVTRYGDALADAADAAAAMQSFPAILERVEGELDEAVAHRAKALGVAAPAGGFQSHFMGTFIYFAGGGRCDDDHCGAEEVGAHAEDLATLVLPAVQEWEAKNPVDLAAVGRVMGAIFGANGAAASANACDWLTAE